MMVMEEKSEDSTSEEQNDTASQSFLCLILVASTRGDVISPHHSLSIAARRSDSSVFHRAASDWTRSRPGQPIPGHILNIRSRWDAKGRYCNLHAQHKQLETPWQYHLGNQYTAREHRGETLEETFSVTQSARRSIGSCFIF